MKTWSVARTQSRQARAGAQAERAAGDIGNVALPFAEKRFNEQVCIYCRGTRGRRTGILPITGPVFYCKNHAKLYQEDKVWEAKHKKGL